MLLRKHNPEQEKLVRIVGPKNSRVGGVDNRRKSVQANVYGNPVVLNGESGRKSKFIHLEADSMSERLHNAALLGDMVE